MKLDQMSRVKRYRSWWETCWESPPDACARSQLHAASAHLLFCVFFFYLLQFRAVNSASSFHHLVFPEKTHTHQMNDNIAACMMDVQLDKLSKLCSCFVFCSWHTAKTSGKRSCSLRQIQCFSVLIILAGNLVDVTCAVCLCWILNQVVQEAAVSKHAWHSSNRFILSNQADENMNETCPGQHFHHGTACHWAWAFLLFFSFWVSHSVMTFWIKSRGRKI